jgi:hypothetical protein
LVTTKGTKEHKESCELTTSPLYYEPPDRSRSAGSVVKFWLRPCRAVLLSTRILRPATLFGKRRAAPAYSVFSVASVTAATENVSRFCRMKIQDQYPAIIPLSRFSPCLCVSVVDFGFGCGDVAQCCEPPESFKCLWFQEYAPPLRIRVDSRSFAAQLVFPLCSFVSSVVKALFCNRCSASISAARQVAMPRSRAILKISDRQS